MAGLSVGGEPISGPGIPAAFRLANFDPRLFFNLRTS